MGNIVEATIELVHGDGLGVDRGDVGLHLLHLALSTKLRKGSLEDFEACSLAREGIADNH